ncbi:MAG TPA: hypothetical protein VIY90_23780 [Steroidobacteraceae bacterium]
MGGDDPGGGPRGWRLRCHGYAPRIQAPQLAPGGLEEWLLAHGYALAASSYSQAGWALAQAVPDQRATLTVITARIGTPRVTLTWGDSVGGLVTTAPQLRAASVQAAGHCRFSAGEYVAALRTVETRLRAGNRICHTKDDEKSTIRK